MVKVSEDISELFKRIQNFYKEIDLSIIKLIKTI